MLLTRYRLGLSAILSERKSSRERSENVDEGFNEGAGTCSERERSVYRWTPIPGTTTSYHDTKVSATSTRLSIVGID